MMIIKVVEKNMKLLYHDKSHCKFDKIRINLFMKIKWFWKVNGTIRSGPTDAGKVLLVFFSNFSLLKL